MLNTIKLKQHSTERHFIITKVHFLKMLQKYLTCCLEADHRHKKKEETGMSFYLYVFLFSFVLVHCHRMSLSIDERDKSLSLDEAGLAAPPLPRFQGRQAVPRQYPW